MREKKKKEKTKYAQINEDYEEEASTWTKTVKETYSKPGSSTNGNQCEQAYQTYQWWLEGVVLSLSYVHLHRGGIWSFM